MTATRRSATRSLVFGLATASLLARRGWAQDKAATTVPGADWAKAQSLREAGFTEAGIAALEARLVELPTTAFLVVTGGRIAYAYGDIAQPSYLASARKSVLSMLYGKYVANGTIDLDRTMNELGIDEADGLLPIERTARIRDLLIASSGVYHAAGSRATIRTRHRAAPGNPARSSITTTGTSMCSARCSRS